MWKLYTCFLLVAASLAAQNPNTAAYPGAIPTDTDLLVATNQARTVLSNTITAVETAIAVPDASKFLAPGVFAVGLEIVKYCSIVGNTFNVCVGGRGFDGTTAVLHISGSAVVGIAAAHFPNQHAAEIKAIATALGVQLSNVQGSGVPVSTSFDWSQATQTPEDDLAAATQDSITLTPCPAGVAGANANHYVFLDDADDSPADEAVIIEGGTCTSGGATGTILVTSTSARTGGDYTVSSASAGIREALLSETGPTAVRVPPGTHVIEERITLDEHADSLVGLGSGGTLTNAGHPLGINPQADVIISWAGAATGGIMIEVLAPAGSPPAGGVRRNVKVENLAIDGKGTAVNGLWAQACSGCEFRNLIFPNHNPGTGNGAIYLTSGDASFINNVFDRIEIRTATASAGACLYLDQGTTGNVTQNQFRFMTCSYFGAEGGFVLFAADNNLFFDVQMSCGDGSCGAGVLYPSTAIACGSNHFVFLGGTYENNCPGTAPNDLIIDYSTDADPDTRITLGGANATVMLIDDDPDALGKLYSDHGWWSTAPVPDQYFTLLDEFVGGDATVGLFGDLGWTLTNGSAAHTSLSSSLGLLRLATGSVINTYTSIKTVGLVNVDNPFRLEYRAQLVFTANVDARIGLMSDPTADPPNDGVYFEQLAADASWFGVTRDVSTETRSAAVAAVGATFERFNIREDASGDVCFSIDGGAEQCNSTNIPLGKTLCLGVAIGNTTAQDKRIRVDYMKFQVKVTR